MAALPRRILKETAKLTQDPVPGIEAVPDEKNARYFHIKVFGPADSPYENGNFCLVVTLTSNIANYLKNSRQVRFGAISA